MIELKAEEVIEHFDESVLSRPQLVSVVTFVQRLVQEGLLAFQADKTLGTTAQGEKILGQFVVEPRTIRIDVSLVNDVRFPFTLAHEFGHMVLHRDIAVEKSAYADIRDTERDLVTFHKILTTPREWIEWQANYFASALLVPKATVHSAVADIQRELGVTRNLGIVYVDGSASSIRDFESVTERLCVTYDVSRTLMRNRLSDVGILRDVRGKDLRHISEFLRAVD